MPRLLLLRRWAPVVIALAAVFCVLILVGPALAQDSGGEAPAKVEKSVFVHIIESAGWIFSFALGIPSIALVAICVLLALDLRMSVAIPPGFVDEFIDTVNKRRFREAFEMARDDTSFLGRVLSAGMARLQYGIEDARVRATFVARFLVRLDQMALRGHIGRIGSGQGVRWQLL